MPKYVDGAGLSRFWDNIQDQIGSASQAQVDAWLTAHPEATTTVQDGAITTAKLADEAVTDAKLAQTGGVLEDVATIGSVAALDSIVAIPWAQGEGNSGIYYTNGTVHGATSFRNTDFVDVRAFSSITYKRASTTSTSGSFGMAFYDADKSYVSGERVVLSAPSYAYEDSTIDVPAGARYARFSLLTSDVSSFSVHGRSKVVAIAANNDGTSAPLAYSLAEDSGGIRSDNGEVYDSSTYAHTGFVDVGAVGTITYAQLLAVATNSVLGMAFYDGNKTFMRGERLVRSAPSNGYKLTTTEVPLGARYARFTLYASLADSFSLSGVSRSGEAYRDSRRHLRWLTLGNSYSVDSMMYVPAILKAAGVTCEVVMCERGGLSLDDLYDEWESDAASETVTGDYGHSGTFYRHLYHIDTRYGKEWVSETIKSAKACVEEGGYDFITLQQFSGYAPDATTYEPYLTNIVSLISESIDKPTQLAWVMGCSRSTRDDSAGIINAVQTAVMGSQPFDFLMPYGTAIFNARTNATLAALGDYTDHNLWCSDGVHLQDGIPRYIAALAVAKSILDRFYPQDGVMFDKLRVDATAMSEWAVKQDHLPVTGVTDANCLLAQKAAVLACNHPFTVTQM